MPLLLNVLQNANTAEYGKLRMKAMECAGLIGTLASTAGPYTLLIFLLYISTIFFADIRLTSNIFNAPGAYLKPLPSDETSSDPMRMHLLSS